MSKVDQSSHDYPNVDDYNRLSNLPFYQTYINEADYVLEEQSNGTYLLTKSCDSSLTVGDEIVLADFLAAHSNLVVLSLDGGIARYNLDSSSVPADIMVNDEPLSGNFRAVKLGDINVEDKIVIVGK